MLFPLVPNLQTQKVLPKSKGVLWYEVSQRDNSRRSFCLAKHTPTIHPQESHGQNGCKRIPLILPWEWQQVRFIFPGQRMKANSLPRQPDYQSSLWVLPEFNANEDSCHQDGILCSNLPGRKEGFMHFGGCRGYHNFCPCLTAYVSGYIHSQQNCWGRVGVQGGRPQTAVVLETRKTLKNSIASNTKSQEGKSTDSGQHNGKWDSCLWLIPSGGKKIP